MNMLKTQTFLSVNIGFTIESSYLDFLNILFDISVKIF